MALTKYKSQFKNLESINLSDFHVSDLYSTLPAKFPERKLSYFPLRSKLLKFSSVCILSDGINDYLVSKAFSFKLNKNSKFFYHIFLDGDFIRVAAFCPHIIAKRFGGVYRVYHFLLPTDINQHSFLDAITGISALCFSRVLEARKEYYVTVNC